MGKHAVMKRNVFFTLIYTYKLRSFLVHLHWKIVLLCVAVCMDGFDIWAYNVSKQISNDILTLSSITQFLAFYCI